MYFDSVNEIKKKIRLIKNNARFLVLFQGMILLFLVFNYAAHDISFSSIIKVFLYQFFGWYLSGRVIVSLLKIRVDNYSELLALSYTFGAISALLIYIMFMLPGLGFLLPLFTVVEGAGAAFYLYKKEMGIENYKADIFGMWVCLSFFAIFLLLSFFAVSLVNSLPNEVANGIGYYVDWPFWAGNNISFLKGFPADTFRQVGTPLRYHHFSSILIAQMSLCTGVDVNWISFYFSSIVAGIVFVLSGYYFSTRLVKSKWLIVVTMMAALFSDGSTVTFTWHTTICPFGFDYGYAFGMMSLALLVEIVKRDRFEELFLPSCMFLAMTTGCKAPIGVVVLVAYGVVALSYLLRREFKRGLLSGACWLGSFLAVYFAFISFHRTFSSEPGGIQYIGGLGLDTIVKKARGVAGIYNWLTTEYMIEGDPLLMKLYAVWLYIYRTNKVVMTLLLIAIGLIIMDLRKMKLDSILYSLVISSLVGIILSIYLTQSGGSQEYFIIGQFPSASMAGGYALERIFEEKQQKKSSNGSYLAVCMVLVFTLGISATRYYHTIMQKVREGVNVARDKYTYEDYKCYYADPIDYEAFEWIKNNTPEDALIVADSFADTYGRDNSMIMGVFSQRFIWNEKLYVNDPEEAERRNEILYEVIDNPDENMGRLKDEGVDYLVYQISEFDDDYASQCSFLSEVFRNDHYVVYEIVS